jgi:hypothetical protein
MALWIFTIYSTSRISVFVILQNKTIKPYHTFDNIGLAIFKWMSMLNLTVLLLDVPFLAKYGKMSANFKRLKTLNPPEFLLVTQFSTNSILNPTSLLIGHAIFNRIWEDGRIWTCLHSYWLRHFHVSWVGMQGVSLLTLAVWTCKVFPFPWPAVWLCMMYLFAIQAVWTMDMQDVSLCTTSSINVQGLSVSLSTASSVDMQLLCYCEKM